MDSSKPCFSSTISCWTLATTNLALLNSLWSLLISVFDSSLFSSIFIEQDVCNSAIASSYDLSNSIAFLSAFSTRFSYDLSTSKAFLCASAARRSYDRTRSEICLSWLLSISFACFSNELLISSFAARRTSAYDPRRRRIVDLRTDSYSAFRTSASAFFSRSFIRLPVIFRVSCFTHASNMALLERESHNSDPNSKTAASKTFHSPLKVESTVLRFAFALTVSFTELIAAR
mmetsp:Transcript_24076/g.48058  ORF Transcript_24076/g.48058 Transcript_24076/m.48058 type:complete len:231 (-) Transcript_24076:326-1018(-)